MDIVCMIPPIDEVESIRLNRDQAILIAIGSMGFLVFAITVAAIKDAFPGNAVMAVIMPLCIIGVGFIGLNRLEHNMVKSIFLTGYPAMVITLRCGEGAIVGNKVSQYLRWWHTIVIAGVIVGLFYVLKPLPVETLSIIKGGWAFLGVGLAAILWTRTMAKAPIIQNPLSIIAVFAVFSSTLVYVSVSSLERSFYQWALPVGLLLGVISRRVSPQKNISANGVVLKFKARE